MKKVLFLFFLTLFVTMGASARQVPIDIKVNGEFIYVSAKPYLYEMRTFVPIRFVAEALGCNVTWENDTATITGDNVIEIKPLTGEVFVNGEIRKVSPAPQEVNDRIYVPVRFVAETLGCTVNWDNKYYCVEIEKAGITVPKDIIIGSPYDRDVIFWLARIIESESSGECYDGKIAVGNVVLNRVKSKSFPNTVYDVIFDKKFGVQFQPVANGTIFNNPSEQSYTAAKLALSGENLVGESLFFLNPRTAGSLWITKTRKFYCRIGNHDFYL